MSLLFLRILLRLALFLVLFLDLSLYLCNLLYMYIHSLCSRCLLNYCCYHYLLLPNLYLLHRMYIHLLLLYSHLHLLYHHTQIHLLYDLEQLVHLCLYLNNLPLVVILLFLYNRLLFRSGRRKWRDGRW